MSPRPEWLAVAEAWEAPRPGWTWHHTTRTWQAGTGTGWRYVPLDEDGTWRWMTYESQGDREYDIPEAAMDAADEAWRRERAP